MRSITIVGEIDVILKAYKNVGHVFYRKMNTTENVFNDTIMAEIHNVVYDKPYDILPGDWVEAFEQKDINPQKTNRFWCSALVGYIYTKCGVLDSNTDWSIMTPNNLSLDGEKLKFNQGVSLSNTETRLF